MLHRAERLIEFSIQSTNGEVGHLDDFYFDDENWTVRYLVVTVGSWLDRHSVLISPHAVSHLDWEAEQLVVNLTREQIEASPDLNLDNPVSRQMEHELHLHYEWPLYWSMAPAGVEMAAAQPHLPVNPAYPMSKEGSKVRSQQEGDPHLRSFREVDGYHIQATDGEIGHLEDLFVSAEEWDIQYLLIDTRNWLPGKKVLVAPSWITDVDWADAKLHVDHTREEVKNAPEYDPKAPLERGYESALWNHYGFKGYWL